MTGQHMIALCRSCAAEIYGTRAPTPHYAEAVAMLLAGTAAQESLLVHRRQIGFDLQSDGGAWGLWQMEQDAVSDATRYLRERPDVRDRAARWLLGSGRHDMAGILCMGSHGLMRLIHDWDRFGCLCSRLYYMGFAEPVPEAVAEQARYWKRYHNKLKGKGTPGQYVERFNQLIRPLL